MTVRLRQRDRGRHAPVCVQANESTPPGGTLRSTKRRYSDQNTVDATREVQRSSARTVHRRRCRHPRRAPRRTDRSTRPAVEGPPRGPRSTRASAAVIPARIAACNPKLRLRLTSCRAEWHHRQRIRSRRVRVVGAAIDDEDPLELRVRAGARAAICRRRSGRLPRCRRPARPLHASFVIER